VGRSVETWVLTTRCVTNGAAARQREELHASQPMRRAVPSSMEISGASSWLPQTTTYGLIALRLLWSSATMRICLTLFDVGPSSDAQRYRIVIATHVVIMTMIVAFLTMRASFHCSRPAVVGGILFMAMYGFVANIAGIGGGSVSYTIDIVMLCAIVQCSTTISMCFLMKPRSVAPANEHSAAPSIAVRHRWNASHLRSLPEEGTNNLRTTRLRRASTSDFSVHDFEPHVEGVQYASPCSVCLQGALANAVREGGEMSIVISESWVGCGQCAGMFHASCLEEWVGHEMQRGNQLVQCPLCRCIIHTDLCCILDGSCVKIPPCAPQNPLVLDGGNT
jgi:hypothetical protein